jgi:hypothetical protein
LKQDFSSGHGIPQPQPVEEKKIAWQDISMLVTAPDKAIKRIASRGRPVRHTGNARKLVKKVKARRLSKKTRVVLILTLLGILTPSIILTVSFGVNLYIIYNYATKGVQHLQQVQAVFSDVKSHPNELVDPNKLHTAQKELVAAQGDFQRLHMMLESDAFINTPSAVIPVFNPQIASARSFPDLDLTILPTPGDCAALKTQGMHFEGVLSGVDPTFTVTTFDPKTRNGAGCYLQPRI